MEKRKSTNKKLVIISVLGVIAWFLFSIRFFGITREASEFSTEGAQPVIKILEILNYRGNELLPFFILFFILVSFSLLFDIYLYLYIKKNELKKSMFILAGTVTTIFIILNLVNELFLLLAILVAVAMLIMISIAITVNHLYVEKEEIDLINHGPFKTLTTAEKYANKKIIQIKKKSVLADTRVFSTIDLEASEGYYVTIYIEETNNRGNENGENDERE